MEIKEENQTQQNGQNPTKRSSPIQNLENKGSILSPRFRSAAAMAGWDEEALLLASLVVEDTPVRESKHKKRAHLHFKTPPTSSRRKRRGQRHSPAPIPALVLSLHDEETVQKENGAKSENKEIHVTEENKGDLTSGSSLGQALPCMDRLREELSCAICLEICFEPSTTPCGHSFCKKCLKSAADKCGKQCPKCRQLIGTGRSCTVNTVLWNTIQLLFPEEVEARKVAAATCSREAKRQSPKCGRNNVVNANSGSISRSSNRSMRRRGTPSQAEDAALALRMQREEFMEAFRGSNEQLSSISSARENLRAMASRALNIRLRRHQR